MLVSFSSEKYKKWSFSFNSSLVGIWFTLRIGFYFDALILIPESDMFDFSPEFSFERSVMTSSLCWEKFLNYWEVADSKILFVSGSWVGVCTTFCGYLFYFYIWVWGYELTLYPNARWGFSRADPLLEGIYFFIWSVDFWLVVILCGNMNWFPAFDPAGKSRFRGTKSKSNIWRVSCCINKSNEFCTCEEKSISSSFRGWSIVKMRRSLQAPLIWMRSIDLKLTSLKQWFPKPKTSIARLIH